MSETAQTLAIRAQQRKAERNAAQELLRAAFQDLREVRGGRFQRARLLLPEASEEMRFVAELAGVTSKKVREMVTVEGTAQNHPGGSTR